MTYAERIETARNKIYLSKCSAMQVATIKIRQLIDDTKKRRAEMETENVQNN